MKSTKVLKSQFIQFLFVSGINTLFGYGVFALFIFLGIHYAVASFLATVVGVLFNFQTTGKIVFNNSDNGLLFKFIGVYITTYLLNVAFLKIFSNLKVNMFLAGALLLLPMAITAYLLNKTFVFKRGLKWSS